MDTEIAHAGNVSFPRIKKLSLSGFLAFPPSRPTSLDIDLGEDGKNLLLYGENGIGKTSLFRALRDLFDTGNRPRNYADHQNVFIQEEDDAIAVQLTSGTPSEFRWEVGENHPKETEGAPFQSFGGQCPEQSRG
jgi:recombinational DNA repair ATPase RecF